MSEEDEVLLQAYLDGELPEADAERVRTRIANQPEWAHMEQRLRDALGDVARGFAAVETEDQITAAAEGELVPPTRSHTGRYTLSAVLAIAAALIVLSRAKMGHRVADGTNRQAEMATASPTAAAPQQGGGGGDTNGGGKHRIDPIVPAQSDGASMTPKPSHTPSPRFNPPSPNATATIVGAHLLGVKVDSTVGPIIKQLSFALSDNSVVTLETMPEPREGTRGGAWASATADTAPVLGHLDDDTTLTWRNGKGMILRLRGKLSPRRLAQVRGLIRGG